MKVGTEIRADVSAAFDTRRRRRRKGAPTAKKHRNATMTLSDSALLSAGNVAK